MKAGTFLCIPLLLLGWGAAWADVCADIRMEKQGDRYYFNSGVDECCLVKYKDQAGLTRYLELDGDEIYKARSELPAEVVRILGGELCDTAWQRQRQKGQTAKKSNHRARSKPRAEDPDVDLGDLDDLDDLGGLDDLGDLDGLMDLDEIDTSFNAAKEARELESDLAEWKQEQQRKKEEAERRRLKEQQERLIAEQRRRAREAREAAERRQRELAELEARMEAQRREQARRQNEIGVFDVLGALAQGYMAGQAIRNGLDPSPYMYGNGLSMPSFNTPSYNSGPSANCLAQSERLAQQMANQARPQGDLNNCGLYKQMRNFYQQSLALHNRCPSLDPTGEQRRIFQSQINDLNKSIAEACSARSYNYGAVPALPALPSSNTGSSSGGGYYRKKCPPGRTCATRLGSP